MIGVSVLFLCFAIIESVYSLCSLVGEFETTVILGFHDDGLLYGNLMLTFDEDKSFNWQYKATVVGEDNKSLVKYECASNIKGQAAVEPHDNNRFELSLAVSHCNTTGSLQKYQGALCTNCQNLNKVSYPYAAWVGQNNICDSLSLNGVFGALKRL